MQPKTQCLVYYNYLLLSEYRSVMLTMDVIDFDRLIN